MTLASACAAPTAALKPRGLAPLNLKLHDLDGHELAMGNLRGQIVILDFWATWCEPCRAGLPKTEALVRANAARGVQGLAVSIDASAKDIPAFVAQEKLGLRVLHDPDGDEAQRLGAAGIPYLIILDREGYVRYANLGAGPAAEAAAAQALQALLAE
ncbi:MAG: TlpA family protein disulfide reductase [Deltaproteobacteria bacterium]|nr:TlpA family protein disulfide reductase [Deltaproteobacteria bacterium]